MIRSPKLVKLMLMLVWKLSATVVFSREVVV